MDHSIGFNVFSSSEERKTVLNKLYNKMTSVRWKINWFVLAGMVLFGIIVYMIANYIPSEKGLKFKVDGVKLEQRREYSVWPMFTTDASTNNPLFFKQRCAPVINYTMSNLVSVKKQWKMSRDFGCQALYDKFTSIFTMEDREAPLMLPDDFKAKVKGWFGNDDNLYQQVYNQEVIHVVSEYTREHTIFNSLRDKRPVVPPAESEDDYFQGILAKSAKSCDFCNYKQYTAEHIFGRVESNHSFTASNAFKLDSLHALIAPKKHDPLHWNLTEFLDLFGLVKTWLTKAHRFYPDARFPALIWDVLPKCGASQIHPHLHVMFDSKRYHGQVEAWRLGAEDYFKDHKTNYFTDLVAVYTALNLTVSQGSAVAFASIVPKRDHEVVVMSAEADEDFYKLLYIVLRAFIDKLEVKCFSMGLGLPAFDAYGGKIPAFARIITRGYVTDIRSDISSFELFLAASVNIDPYKTMQLIKSYKMSQKDAKR